MAFVHRSRLVGRFPSPRGSRPFTFDGTELDDLDPDAGKISATGGTVDVLDPNLPDPLLAPEILGGSALMRLALLSRGPQL